MIQSAKEILLSPFSHMTIPVQEILKRLVMELENIGDQIGTESAFSTDQNRSQFTLAQLGMDS